MTAPTLRLNDGHTIPQIGLGTYPMDDAEATAVIADALQAGYRHVDTAYKYGNEKGVGAGVRGSGVPRAEVFITTKIDGDYLGPKAREGVEGCLERLGVSYIDLLLIHWPLPARGLHLDTWQAMIGFVSEGLVRSIGVSNYKPAHLDRLIAESGVTPAVNQIELSPRITRADHRAYDAAHGIVTTSWSPLGKGVLDDDRVAHVAAKHAVTPAQVIVRWHVQQGLVVIPKSSSRERLRANLDVFRFVLDPADLALLAQLDEGPGAGVDSDQTGH
ncbi:MAG TPA: aldo/keto reductase [Propionibacteriaceae bacterium]|mgnify:FL=1|nr:aldo/keto reductase [Propionibacteriaceae bacterium]